jgi:hypothetical protein
VVVRVAFRQTVLPEKEHRARFSKEMYVHHGKRCSMYSVQLLGDHNVRLTLRVGKYPSMSREIIRPFLIPERTSGISNSVLEDQEFSVSRVAFRHSVAVYRQAVDLRGNIPTIVSQLIHAAGG